MSPSPTIYVAAALLLQVACTAQPDPPVVVFDAAPAPDLAGDLSSDAGGGVTSDATPDIPPPTAPSPPASLTRWLTGASEDVEVTPAGPGLILMGGGGEPDAAFRWWVPLLMGGDVVVLRVSGSDGYNDYLFDDIGGVDSVETLKVDSRALADDPYVAWQIDHAEGVFLAGGNQWDYLSLWSNTALHAALRRVYDRGAVLGGTSAGLAVLGDRAFSAENDTVYSDEALADPYHESMLFEDDFLSVPPLVGAVTDSHFRERDRMGRLVAFVARMWADGFVDPIGIGVDESTALLIGPAGREVVGAGAVYELRAMSAPDVSTPGQPLLWSSIEVTKTTPTEVRSYTVSTAAGAVEPADPY